MLKRQSLSLLIAAGLSATAFAAVASPAKLSTDAPFLSGPGTKYSALAQLNAGALVDIIWCGTTEDWCLVQIHNKKGWVPLAKLNLKVGRKSTAAATGGGGSSSSGSSGGSAGGGGSSGGSSAAGQFSQVGGVTVTQSPPSPVGGPIGCLAPC